MTQASPWRALSHRNFFLFFTGHGISLCGSWMQSMAQAWLVYRMTGSPFMLGVVEFLARSPIFVFGILGGALADRWPRRRLLLITQALMLVQASVLAALTLSGAITIGWLLGLAFFLGLISAVEIPTRQAFLVDLVPRSDIPSAIGLNSSIFNSARVLGPSLAGLVIVAVGEGLCFLLNAVSFLALLGCLAAVRLTPSPPREYRQTRRLLAEGLAYAWRTPHVRALLALASVLSLAALPFTTLLPVFAVDVLGSGPGDLGLLMAATGVGALTAALYLARRSSVRGLDSAIGRSVVCFGMGLLALALSPTMWLSVPALLVVGFGMVSSHAGANTLLQSLAPDELRGRVISLYVTMSLGMSIFGSLLAGGGATYFGAQLTVTIGGLLTIISAAAYYRTLPGIRRHIRDRGLFAPAESAPP